MQTHLVKMLLIAVCAIGLSGCVKMVQVRPEEANLSHKETVKSVDIPIAIVGAQSKSGQTVSFGAQTGLYSGRDQRLTGSDSAGESVSVPLDSVAIIFIRRIDRPPDEKYALPADSFLSATVGKRTTTCGGTLYPMKERVKFDDSDGVYDTLSREISGRSVDGSPVHVRLDAVSFVGKEEFTLNARDSRKLGDGTVFITQPQWYNRVAQVRPEKAKLFHWKAVESIEIPVALVGAVMKSGQMLQFGPPTGTYSRSERRLAGHDSNGDSVMVPEDSVSYVSLRRIDKPPSENYTVPADVFFREGIEGRTAVAGGVLYPRKERVKFDRFGGVYDTLYQEIAGRCRDSSITHVGLDKISGVGTRKFDVLKTVGLTVAATAICLALMAYAWDNAWDDADWGWTSSSTY